MTTTLPTPDYSRLGTVFAVYGGLDPLLCARFSGVPVGGWILVLSMIDDLWVFQVDLEKAGSDRRLTKFIVTCTAFIR